MRFIILLSLLTLFSTVQAYEFVSYVHTDLQGSVVLQSNEHGVVINENKRYAPYGGRLDHQKEADDVSYISKKYNHDTGLSYLNARFYDPEIGRFLSVDPVDVLQQGSRHFNSYAYAYNSPYQLKDPDGELPFLIPLAIFIAKEVAGEVFESYIGIPAPTVKNFGKTAISVAIKQANKDIIKGVAKAPSSVAKKGLPKNPDDLKKSGYADTSHPEAAKRGHRTFENSDTGDKVRFDKGKPGANGYEGKDHYHRSNPGATSKKDQYLDKSGNPCARGCDASHLLPGD